MIDIDLEMKRINNLVRVNGKNEDAFFNRAWLYSYRGDLPEAERDYSRIIQLNRNATHACYNRGLVYISRMKKFARAIQDLSEALRQNPRYSDALCNCGNAYFELGRMDPALKDYDADVYYNMASLFLAQGNTSRAMADIQKAAILEHREAVQYLNRSPGGP